MRKEDFIYNVLNSVDGMSKAIPHDDLFSKIEQKIASKNVVPMQTIWLVAASIVVLISLNIVLLSSSLNENQSEMASLERVINKNNQLYK